MSAFLGPIHHWLFNKITLFEDLEKDTNRSVAAKYGDQALTIQNEAEEKYGACIPELPLENLIDTNNIHGWLQNRISIAEKRQAETLKSPAAASWMSFVQELEASLLPHSLDTQAVLVPSFAVMLCSKRPRPGYRQLRLHPGSVISSFTSGAPTFAGSCR